MKSRHSPDPEAAVRTRPTPAAAVSAAGVVTRHGKSERLNIIVKFALNLSPSFVPVLRALWRPAQGMDRDLILGRPCTRHLTCDAYLGIPYPSY